MICKAPGALAGRYITHTHNNFKLLPCLHHKERGDKERQDALETLVVETFVGGMMMTSG